MCMSTVYRTREYVRRTGVYSVNGVTLQARTLTHMHTRWRANSALEFALHWHLCVSVRVTVCSLLRVLRSLLLCFVYAVTPNYLRCPLIVRAEVEVLFSCLCCCYTYSNTTFHSIATSIYTRIFVGFMSSQSRRITLLV